MVQLTQAFTVLSDDATRKQYDRDVYPGVLRLREMWKAPARVDNMVVSSDSEESVEDEQARKEKHDARVMANFYNRRRPAKFDPSEYNKVKVALTNMVGNIHKKISEPPVSCPPSIVCSQSSPGQCRRHGIQRRHDAPLPTLEATRHAAHGMHRQQAHKIPVHVVLPRVPAFSNGGGSALGLSADLPIRTRRSMSSHRHPVDGQCVAGSWAAALALALEKRGLASYDSTTLDLFKRLTVARHHTPRDCL